MRSTLPVIPDFYPRPPRGGRHQTVQPDVGAIQFLSTPSARRATLLSLDFFKVLEQFLSTPSARRATIVSISIPLLLSISIHALREEGDLPMRAYAMIWQISIHALREEGDKVYFHFFDFAQYFYPRPPRGGRRLVRHSLGRHPEISIHALREEGDSKNRDKISIFKQIIQHSARI